MFFTTPGIFYTESLKTFVQNEMNTQMMYKVEYDLYEQFNDLKSPCVEDLEYRKEKCFFDELEKYLIGKYNCSTPFTPKEMSLKGMNFTGKQGKNWLFGLKPQAFLLNGTLYWRILKLLTKYFKKMVSVKFTPFSKDNICINQSIAIKVQSTYGEWKKHDFKRSNCNKPCHNILTRDHT